MPILLILFAIFGYIYAEVSLLISVGSTVGVLPTILLLILISFAGLWFVKLRGIYTLYAIRQQLAQGQLPTDAVLSSVLFVIAGVLLIIPGFLSDILAILCVLPVTRHFLQHFLIKMFKNKIQFRPFSGFQADNRTTFEAEFQRQQERDKWVK